MARKFIINDNTLLIGNVEFHFQLAKKHEATKGGGWWHRDIETDTIFLYSISTDYGGARLEDVQNAVKNGLTSLSIGKMRIVFSENIMLEDAMKNYTVIKENG